MKPSPARYTVRRLVVAAATIALAALATIASIVVLKDWTPRVRVPSLFVEEAPPPQSANIDHEIFEIVLSDLIGNAELNPTAGELDVKKPQVVLCGTTSGHGVSYPAMESDIDNSEITVPPDVRDDVVRRNPTGRRFSLKQPRGPDAGADAPAPPASRPSTRAAEGTDRWDAPQGRQTPSGCAAREEAASISPGVTSPRRSPPPW
jgi:hypothetical protein